MWRLLQGAPAHNLVIAICGLAAGWLLAWFYFRQRIRIMEMRLSDYSERREALYAADVKHLICPVCKSRAMHRSNKRSPGVLIGMMFGRVPFRCERCFVVSMHWARTAYAIGKHIDTPEKLKDERNKFTADLETARKMKRLYPEMFPPRDPLKPPDSPLR